MGHSLELRKPLVDAKLLEALGPFVSTFVGRAGKAILAQSPKKPLPDLVVNRPKTGYSLRMEKWPSEATRMVAADDLLLLTSSRAPWARCWARSVLAEFT